MINKVVKSEKGENDTVRVARGRDKRDNHFNLKTTPAIATITAINNPQPSTVHKSKVLIPVSVYLVKQK